MKAQRSDHSMGVAALFTVALVYGMWGILAREADVMFSHSGQAAVRQVICLALVALLVVCTRPALSLPKDKRKVIVVIGLATPVTGLAWVVAANSTTVANATFMLYVGAILTTALTAWFVHREPLTRTQALSCVFAIGGLAMYAEPVAALSVGVVAGLLSGVTGGVIATCSKLVRDLPRFTVMLYQAMFGAAGALLTLLFVDDPVVKAFDWQSLIALVVFAFAVIGVSWLMLYGFARVNVGSGSIILAAEILFATVLAYYIYAEVPSSLEAFGGLLVLGAAVVGCIPSRQLLNNAKL